MIRLRAGKRQGAGSMPGAYSDDDQARAAISPGQLAMRGRVVAVDAAAEHRDVTPARLERAAMRLAVDAARQPADDHKPGGRELAAERARDRAAVGEHARAPTIATAGRPSSSTSPSPRR